MLKKLLVFLSVFFFVISSSIHVSANEEVNEFPDYEEIEIIDELTLKDQDDTYYFFETQDDRDMFLIMLQDMSVQLYACLPGDPGYPTCSDKTVVRIESIRVRSYHTGLLSQGGYLLDDWTFGGSEGASMTLTESKEITFGYEGISCTLSVSHSQTFNVPVNRRGNIRYRADFLVTVYQNYFILKDGSRVVGNQYKTMKKSWGEFYPVYK